MAQQDLGISSEAEANITSNLLAIRARMARSAVDVDRSPQDVELVCVTKGQDGQSILPALMAGERVFGENRVQEASQKWPALKTQFPSVELHLIGPLQTNKVRDALRLFDVIETVDRTSLAEAIARETVLSGRTPRLFVQVNTGRESQKAGILPEDADAFIRFCRVDCGLAIDGLMCIPPMTEQASPHFGLLSLLATRNGIEKLSMGMSGDFELGIQLGATHVRIGSAIFGPRMTHPNPE